MVQFKQLSTLFFLIVSCTVVLAQPPGKHWEAVAYNESTNELAVFSGTENRDNKWIVTDSLWLYNGKWRFVDGNDITGRWAHALVYHDNDLYSYGGLVYNTQQEEVLVNDLYQFKNSWHKVTEGPKLHLPSLFSFDGNLFLAGQPYMDMKSFEVWQLVGNTFVKRSSVDLGGERDGLRTLLVKNNIVVTYPTDEGLFFHNVTTGFITVVKDIPKRTKFGITYNAKLDSYFLFGGLDENRNFSNDLRQIKNGRSEKLNPDSSPSPRASCNMVPTTRGFILYGGAENGGKLSTAIWAFENGQWARKE